MTSASPRSIYARLPFFYGWVIVAVVFVTMGVGVNARTAFSLLFPPILDEFGWERGMTAGAFSFGFIVSAIMSPSLGRLMDRRGPLVVNELGVVLIGSGLLLATLVQQPWQLYATLGMLVGGGSVCLGYTGQGLFLPNWFVRRRGLAMSLAFSGVGVGSIILLPWLQSLIARAGWRSACWHSASWCWCCCCRSISCCGAGRRTSGSQPDGDASSQWPPRAGRPRTSSTRPGSRSTGRSAAPCAPPLLVDRRRLFLRPVRLVRGAGASDEIPDRDRLQPGTRRLGAWAASALPASRARSRSAICPIGSGASSCGRSAALASP